MLTGGKRENGWTWVAGWIFIYGYKQNKLAGAEIHAVGLWLVFMLSYHFYYFSMNKPTFGVNFNPVSPSPDYLCAWLYYYEKSRELVAPSPAGSAYFAVVGFAHPVLSELSLCAHPEHAME